MGDQMFGIVKCGQCRYGVPQNAALKHGLITCQRHPPTAVLMPAQDAMGRQGVALQAVWPSTKKDDGCGDGMLAIPAATGESMPVRIIGQHNGNDAA
jgi:hypothetical protein